MEGAGQQSQRVEGRATRVAEGRAQLDEAAVRAMMMKGGAIGGDEEDGDYDEELEYEYRP